MAAPTMPQIRISGGQATGLNIYPHATAGFPSSVYKLLPDVRLFGTGMLADVGKYSRNGAAE